MLGFGKNKSNGRTYEWSDGTVHDCPQPGRGSKGSQVAGNGYSDDGGAGLSQHLYSLHDEERAAAGRQDWDRAAEVKHMLSNADSRAHWESKAQESLQEYASDPAFAQKMYNICMANARQAPNR